MNLEKNNLRDLKRFENKLFIVYLSEFKSKKVKINLIVNFFNLSYQSNLKLILINFTFKFTFAYL